MSIATDIEKVCYDINTYIRVCQNHPSKLTMSYTDNVVCFCRFADGSEIKAEKRGEYVFVRINSVGHDFEVKKGE